MMEAHIVCGGPDLWLPEKLGGLIVGVDRGALALIERNINFDTVIGDFDSVSEAQRLMIKDRVTFFVDLPAEKDVTDCEAAVEHVVNLGIKKIYLYGVSGGRFDHQFAIIGLMLKYRKMDIEICSIDEKNQISILAPGDYQIPSMEKKYVSFFALERTVKHLTLEMVKYPLKGYELAVSDSLCVSNEPLKQWFGLKFDSSYLLMVQSSD